MNGIAELVDQVTDGLSQLRQLLDDPSALPLATITRDIARLERAMDKKAYVDAAFAQACVLADAGKLVGANHPDAYLTEKLGISRGEAYNRLARAKALFDAPPPPEPDLGDLFGDDDTEEDRSAAEEAARKAADEEAERRRKDQEEARKRADEVPAVKQDIIRRELDKLLKAAEGERMRIYARAMEQAKYRDEKDLRLFVKRLVAEANKPHAKANPNAGFEKRDASLGRENSDGTFDVTLSMTRADYALYKALTDKGLSPNSNIPEELQGDRDPRTKGQRRYDQYMAILRQYEEGQQAANGGAASVVMSITLDDLAGADANTLFQTNVGVELDAFDLVRLGMDGTSDFLLTVDGLSGVPLHLGRSRRLASVGQRIAMFAVQGVCSWAGCTTSMSECEAHHIISWLRYGATDIENLTGLCPTHHRCNNDHRDGSFNKGYMDYDPETGGAVLVKADGTRHTNTTDPAMHSAVNRIRAKRNSTSAPPPAETHWPTSPPPPPGRAGRANHRPTHRMPMRP
ncbi:HNH endonuclease [Corynebacterium afermentans]|uniref:HNH endonuclease signature motif containing protein n=1 Tax=Corynebacterium afermentans TaxID=38286 RepID=UPI00257226C7|nr:HNH endonuclease signature motif containing protein [Corynebacterium afermentans]MCG7290989.1 HNH endonuclease [Corynebacterium afermentans]